MTPERSEYYRLLLQLGYGEEYDEALDRALLEEDPLSDLVLALACCGSDRNKTIGVLGEYLLDHPADGEQVCDLLLEYFGRCYHQGSLTLGETVEILYHMAFSQPDPWATPYERLLEPSYHWEYVEMGIADEKEFVRQFENWLLHRGRVSLF